MLLYQEPTTAIKTVKRKVKETESPILSNQILKIIHETPNPTQTMMKIAANTANNQVIPSKIATKRCESTHNEFKEERKAPANFR